MQRDDDQTPDEAAEELPDEGVPAATAEEAEASEPGTALPPKLESWRRRSAAGAILTGFALGLQEALDPHKDEPQIVVQTSGDPPKDLPVEADFEYGRPRQSKVNIRPWLLSDPNARPSGPTATGAGGDDETGGGDGSNDEEHG